MLLGRYSVKNRGGNLVHGFYATFVRSPRQCAHPTQRHAGRAGQIPVQNMWLSCPVCAGGGGQSHPVGASSEAVGRAQRSIMRATGASRMTVTELLKKAAVASPLLPRSKKAQRNSQKRSHWTSCRTSCRPLLAGASAKSDCGGPSGGPRAAPWPGCLVAAAARRLCAALSRRYQRHCCYHTDPREAYAQCCLPATTGHGPRAAATRALSRQLIVRCATGAACSCASPARLAKAWPSTRPAL